MSEQIELPSNYEKKMDELLKSHPYPDWEDTTSYQRDSLGAQVEVIPQAPSASVSDKLQQLNTLRLAGITTGTTIDDLLQEIVDTGGYQKHPPIPFKFEL